MRRFRLNFTLLVSGVGLAALFAGMAFAHGKIAPAMLILIAAGALAAALWGLVRRLISVMVSFSRALEMGDASLKLHVGQDDRELREMSDSANRVMARFRSNCLELETRKLYYDRILNVMTHEMRNSITPVIALSADMSEHPDRYGHDELVDALEIIHNESCGIKRFLDAYYEPVSYTHLTLPTKLEV